MPVMQFRGQNCQMHPETEDMNRAQFATGQDRLDYNEAIWTSQMAIRAKDTNLGTFRVNWKLAKPLYCKTALHQGVCDMIFAVSQLC
jgi:hypothetical protein